jgi:PAS domain S-box-containing protein
MATPNKTFTADRFDAVAELIPVGIIRMDPRGSCLYVNARWSLLTGLSLQAASGDGWIRAVDPEDRERVVRKIREAALDAGEFADEFRLRTPDGRNRMVSSRVLPVRGAAGEVAGYLATITDLTEPHRTEEALRDLAKELGDRVKELNCLVGISHIIEAYGDSLPDILQHAVELLASSWGHSDVACARVVLDGKRYQTANYKDTPWKLSSDIVFDNRHVGVAEVGYLKEMPGRDEGPFLMEERRVLDAVAERLGRTAERLKSQQLLREREQDLRERLTRLARVNVMGEMAASIAHEVNQPLTVIASYAQACCRILQADTAGHEQVLNAATQIANEALRAGDIIHRLDQLARKRRDQRSPCDMNELIRDIQPLVAVDARLHDVKLVFDLASSLPPIKTDGVQMQQVLLNLMRNAIDAMESTEPSERVVAVRTIHHADDDNIEVSVTDNGCGVWEGAETRLFEPFFTTKETGIGMGLSISRSIVTAHGGRMWFTRNSDCGTTFHFTIPTNASSHDDSQ